MHPRQRHEHCSLLQEIQRLRAEQIAHVRGYADRKLRYPEQSYDVRNRRISIVILYNSNT